MAPYLHKEMTFRKVHSVQDGKRREHMVSINYKKHINVMEVLICDSNMNPIQVRYCTQVLYQFVTCKNRTHKLSCTFDLQILMKQPSIYGIIDVKIYLEALLKDRLPQNSERSAELTDEQHDQAISPHCSAVGHNTKRK